MKTVLGEVGGSCPTSIRLWVTFTSIESRMLIGFSRITISRKKNRHQLFTFDLISSLSVKRSILHLQGFCSFRPLVFFAVVQPVMIFGFDYSNGVSGSFATGWQEEK